MIEASWGSAGKEKGVRTRVRWIVAVVVVLHGLIHLLGGVKGFGWAEVSALTEPISNLLGVAWLIAALLVVLAGVMLATAARSWWIVGAVAAVAWQGGCPPPCDRSSLSPLSLRPRPPGARLPAF